MGQGPTPWLSDNAVSKEMTALTAALDKHLSRTQAEGACQLKCFSAA